MAIQTEIILFLQDIQSFTPLRSMRLPRTLRPNRPAAHWLVVAMIMVPCASMPTIPIERGSPRIFSSLQVKESSDGLAAYPANFPLTLDCFAIGRTLLWYENGQVLDDVSVEELLGGYKLSSLHIDNLSPTDDLRRFTCSVGSPDDPSVSSSVVLHVI
ncbi:uncharacterized protein LOC125178765, partial [Hyalella azteca]|uniref:Uncharacterized protein LOC125178765 n=1 Tax=Hyalella azteca TaxID=294128 RepID=A0A979FRG3_HYAAZ